MPAIFVLLLTLLLANSAWADPSGCGEGDYKDVALANAIRGSESRKDAIEIKIIKICKGYAKAIVVPGNGNGETETAYLKKAPDKWTVLDIGTGVDPSQLEIPEEVW